jgi:hypothetical protein
VARPRLAERKGTTRNRKSRTIPGQISMERPNGATSHTDEGIRASAAWERGPSSMRAGRVPKCLGGVGKTPTFLTSVKLQWLIPQHLPQYNYNLIGVFRSNFEVIKNRAKSMTLGFCEKNIGEYWGQTPTSCFAVFCGFQRQIFSRLGRLEFSRICPLLLGLVAKIGPRT